MIFLGVPPLTQSQDASMPNLVHRSQAVRESAFASVSAALPAAHRDLLPRKLSGSQSLPSFTRLNDA